MNKRKLVNTTATNITAIGTLSTMQVYPKFANSLEEEKEIILSAKLPVVRICGLFDDDLSEWNGRKDKSYRMRTEYDRNNRVVKSIMDSSLILLSRFLAEHRQESIIVVSEFSKEITLSYARFIAMWTRRNIPMECAALSHKRELVDRLNYNAKMLLVK